MDCFVLLCKTRNDNTGRVIARSEATKQSKPFCPVIARSKATKQSSIFQSIIARSEATKQSSKNFIFIYYNVIENKKIIKKNIIKNKINKKLKYL